MKKILLEIINWTWCLPQNIVGFFVKLFLKGYKVGRYKNANLYVCNLKGGAISLGRYLLFNQYDFSNINTIKHEYGHFKQNLMLGWLYLIIVGLPSFLWANLKCFHNYRINKRISYYERFPENWADKLGGVNRK